MWWATWWAWWAAAAVLGILEVVVPASVFLGFALGAFGTGGILLLDGSALPWLGGFLPGLLLLFALL